MKAKFQNRKRLIGLANRIGLFDATVSTVQEKIGTKEAKDELVNNQRRFVKGILELPLERQNIRIQLLEERATMAEAAHRAKLEQEAKQALEGSSNDSNSTGNP